MQTSISRIFEIDRPIKQVWRSLSNPNEIVTCVPGATLTEQVDENNYKGAVTLKFGPVKASYDGLVTFLERNAATKTMKLKGIGTDVKGKGGADMIMDGVLTEAAGKTSVNVTMNVEVTGMLAQFGSRLINDVSNQVFDQFIANFSNKLAGEAVDNTMSAGSMASTGVKSIWGMIVDFFKGLFGSK
jgi:uncharacterized protein